ncbi:MAG: MurT ligase domain-containing protein [Propionicimonas sp.]|nr:MurT ligase domain-containing protein [Propionicimonas sp.]
MRSLPPRTDPASGSPRLRLAIAAGDLAAWVSRVTGRGSGASIRGQVLTRLVPDAFADLLKGRTVVAVSGTNGKTTTTHLVAAAVRSGLGREADRLVTNADGANLHYGIASALSQAPRADLAVLETDERVVGDMISHGDPRVLVFLNFSRDQLDRHHEIKALGRSWRVALERAGAGGPVIVANACDPLVVWASATAARVVWVETDTLWTADAALCPACGTVLTRAVAGDRARWDCPGCELTQPAGDYRVDGTAIRLPDGRVVEPELRVPGRFNISNAACALAAAIEFGVDADTALAGMTTVTAPAGRFATATFGATRARLLLAKNPAGWAEALPLAASDPVVLAIDSVAADGKDVSWLWDVEYEQLAGRQVIATGPRAQDLAVRLSYAGVDHTIAPDLAAALAGHPDPVDVIATYTPFQRLLKMAGLR